MALVFVNNIGPFTGKGSPVTSLEADGNFYDLYSQITDIADALDAGLLLADPPASVSGTTITFHFADGSTVTDVVVPLPVLQLNPRGAWLNSTAYFYGDLVYVVGIGVFLVMQDHTSVASPGEFDPDLEIGGDVVYRLWFSLASIRPAPPPVIEITASTLTPSLTEANSYYRCTNIDGCVVTIPSHASVAMAVNTELHFRLAGGPLSFDADTDVVLNPPRFGFELASYVGATFTLKQISLDEWDIIGPYGEDAST